MIFVTSGTFTCAGYTLTVASKTMTALSTSSTIWYPSMTTTGARFTSTYTFGGTTTLLNLQQYNGYCGTAGQITVIPPTSQTFTCYTKTTCNIDVGYFTFSAICDDFPNLTYTLTDSTLAAFTIPLSIQSTNENRVKLYIFALSSHIGTYNGVIKTSVYKTYLEAVTYTFVLNIVDQCSIVPFEMSSISSPQTYKLADPKLTLKFTIRMDCFSGTVFTAALSSGQNIPSNLIKFDSTFLEFEIYSEDILVEGSYNIVISANYNSGARTDTMSFILNVDATGWNKYSPIFT